MPNWKRNKHNLSNQMLLTGNMGELYPVGCLEVIPKDAIQMQSSALVRVSPLVAPTMHSCEVRFHQFFVPMRKLWEPGQEAAPNDLGFEEFITGGPDGNDVQTIPTLSHTATPANEPLLQYLGIPPVANLEFNALPVYAVNWIWNEFYRDQDLATGS